MPFNLSERLARVERMKNTLADPDVSPAEQYRQVLNAFKIEVSYTQSWDVVTGADALALRKAIRISKGEAAPDVVFAPVMVSN